MAHESVLLMEATEALALTPHSRVIDATLGSGGHSRRICEALGPDGVLIACDLDGDAIARSRVKLTDCKASVYLHEASYRDIEALIAEHGLLQVDGVLFDLGLSSVQLEDSGRGFSFKKDEPLLMTFSTDAGASLLTASEILNTWEEQSIADVLYGYGEEQFSRRIARAIIEARQLKPIERTQQLADIVTAATPGWYHHRKVHPATKTFQALRIAVNDELTTVRLGLEAALRIIAPKGRIVVISFHSAEDRIAKTVFRDAADAGKGTVLTKKPIVPSPEEIAHNPRARSAKLRIFEGA